MDDILGIGITGTSLTDLERRILRENSPYAVVLFARNVGDAEQTRALIREIKAVAARPPLFMIDQEGGRVDRLRHLIPGLPAVEAFGEGERSEELSEWGGRVIGLVLRWLDIECDLAPVVDVRGEALPKGLERRTFGQDPDTVVTLAGAFMRGLHGAGVASCPKHFPGIGAGSADPHYGATVIDIPLDLLRARDLLPFRALGPAAGAVMIGHGTYPQFDESGLPATLSRKVATEMLRGELGFDGLAVSDDMEMHAVADLDSDESIAERALMAGNDVLLFCANVERVPDLQRFLAGRVNEDAVLRARFAEAVARGERYRDHCRHLRAFAPPPLPSFAAVCEEATRFTSVFAPEANLGSGGKGSTGREEWT